ncbi:MAG TPA: DNA polymerase IV, partial [Kofleriaceae bacterium]|nr:DNA polymerase IV [Kofleriaceae bacterium]
EGFVDATGTERLLGDGRQVALRIKQRVRAELGLVASVGVAPTKFVAKIASDIDKPDGLRVVAPDGVLAFLHALPVSRLWGVGEVTRASLHQLGLHTIGDVAAWPESGLVARLGETSGRHLAALARGQDPRAVEPERDTVSIGHEETFDVDVDDPADLAVILLGQADRVAARLRRSGLRCRVVTVKIKFADFRLVTRRRTLADATSDGSAIGRTAGELLADLEIHGRAGKRCRVRLCGVSAGGLEQRDAPRQLALDEPVRARGERLGDTLDRIADRFGDGVIHRAVHDD